MRVLPNFVHPRAPDGSCVLTNSADNVLRLYNLPAEVYSYDWALLTEMVRPGPGPPPPPAGGPPVFLSELPVWLSAGCRQL